MNLKSILAISLFFLFPLYIFSQKNDTIPWGGSKLIQHGTTLFDDGKYKEAAEFFLRVSKSDPLYASACYELAMTYENLEQYEDGLKKCIESDSIEPNLVRTITLKGSLLDDLGRRDDAINLLEPALKKWPYNQNLIYNLALVYMNKEDYKRAEELLMYSAKFAPYHTGTHLNLGRINYIKGRYAEAYLAYNMAQILNASTRNLSKFERIITGESDSISKPHLYPYPQKGDYSKWKNLSQLLASNIALRKDFPFPGRINYLVTRQSYMLFNKMNFDASDASFYNQFYVRFFKEVYNKNEFDALTAYQMQNVDDKNIQSWIKSNQSKIDKFVDHAKSMINEWREYEFSTVNEAKMMKTHLYDEDGTLMFIGVQVVSNQPSREGAYTKIAPQGYISESGTFVNDKVQGECILYWPDGTIKQRLNYKNGELDGINKTFFTSGKLSGIYPRDNGQQVGTEIEYTQSGKIHRKQSFVKDKAEGNDYNVYRGSGYTVSQEYKNGKLNGNYTETWLNGRLKETASYVDSLRSGSFKRWYANGKIQKTGNYKNDYQSGPFVEYHANGIKKGEGTYNDSAQYIGIHTEYNRTGVIEVTSAGYENGKLNGVETSFYEDGKKQLEFFYNNDKLIKEVCYDRDGKILYEDEAKDGHIKLKLFYKDGMLRREGSYINGKLEGKWLQYSPGGIVIREENWKNDETFGPQKTYYMSGVLKTSYSCDSNKIEGPYREYLENGKLKIIAYYHKGEGNGEYKIYHSNDSILSQLYLNEDKIDGRRFDFGPEGKLSSVIDYSMDNINNITDYIHGVQYASVPYDKDSVAIITKLPNGKIYSKFTLVDGIKEGVYENYYPNGKLKLKQFYVKGNLTGASKAYSPDGQLSSEYNYNLNKLEGAAISYYNGKVVTKESYEEGLQQNYFNEYYPSGKLYRRIKYVDDNREGEYQFFSPDSVLLASLNYEKGACSSITIRTKEGKMTRMLCNDPATKELTSYYPNGAVAAIIPIQKGYLNGTLAFFKADGKKLKVRTYKDDYLEGALESYYENGKLQESMSYKNNDLNGPYVRYSSTGTKLEEGQYNADCKTGCWTYYDSLGKVKYKLYYENDQVYDMQ